MKNRLVALALVLVAASALAGPPVKVSKVVMLGDSTTLSMRSPEGKKLTDCVQKELERMGQTRGWTIEVINAGQGGQTAADGYQRLEQDVIAREPSVVTISFGLNDTGKLTPEQYREALENTLNRLKKKSKAKPCNQHPV